MKFQKILLCGALLGIVAAGCTKVDDSLGNGFVLPDQRMEVRIDTLGIDGPQNILMRMIYNDSLTAFNMGTAFLGAYDDPTMGTTWAGFMATFLPVDSAKYADGFNVVIDSIKFATYLSLQRGEKLSTQKFTAYALTEIISRESDTTYYANFAYETVVDLSKPLFSFKRTTLPVSGGDDLMKVTLTTEGAEYFAAILSDTARYYNDSLFLNTFKGVAIVPDGGNAEKDALFALPYSDTYLTIYTHNYTDATATVVKDTVTVRFSFNDTQTTTENYKYPNKSVDLIRHDYTGSVIDGLYNTGLTVGTAYIQGLAGVTTELEFQNGLFAAIDALRLQAGPNCDILINQAMLYFDVADRSIEALDEAPQRLGMYTDFVRRTTIPDYYYAYEMTTDSYTGELSATRTLPYDGWLNRSLWCYKMNITSYIQHEYQLWRADNMVDRKRITLAPTVYNPAGLYYLKSVGLVGSDVAPAKLRLTYTIIY